MTIEEAEMQGYEPCSRCNPDTTTGVYQPKSTSSSIIKGVSKKNINSIGGSVFKVSGFYRKTQKNDGIETIIILLVGSLGIYALADCFLFIVDENRKKERLLNNEKRNTPK